MSWCHWRENEHNGNAWNKGSHLWLQKIAKLLIQMPRKAQRKDSAGRSFITWTEVLRCREKRLLVAVMLSAQHKYFLIKPGPTTVSKLQPVIQKTNRLQNGKEKSERQKPEEANNHLSDRLNKQGQLNKLDKDIQQLHANVEAVTQSQRHPRPWHGRVGGKSNSAF